MSFESCERCGDDITNAEQLHVCRTCWDAFMRAPEERATVSPAVCIACGVRANDSKIAVEAHALLFYEYGRRGVPLELCAEHVTMLGVCGVSIEIMPLPKRGGVRS